jgi:hypothetical protein
MAIGNAVDRGDQAVYVYDERGTLIATISSGVGSSLMGYTSSTVSIKKPDNCIYTYNEKGTLLSVVHA